MPSGGSVADFVFLVAMFAYTFGVNHGWNLASILTRMRLRVCSGFNDFCIAHGRNHGQLAHVDVALGLVLPNGSNSISAVGSAGMLCAV